MWGVGGRKVFWLDVIHISGTVQRIISLNYVFVFCHLMLNKVNNNKVYNVWKLLVVWRKLTFITGYRKIQISLWFLMGEGRVAYMEGWFRIHLHSPSSIGIVNPLAPICGDVTSIMQHLRSRKQQTPTSD